MYTSKTSSLWRGRWDAEIACVSGSLANLVKAIMDMFQILDLR